MSSESSSHKRRSAGSSVPSPPRTPPRRSSPAPFAPASPSRQFSTSAISASFHSQPLSHRGTDEDADAEHGGVPGDGFEEGIERTRARLSVIGLPLPDEAGPTKTGDLSPKEEGALRTLDRYGFFSASPTMRQESRLALLPAAPFTHKIKRLQATASPVSVSQVPSPPEFKHVTPPKPPTKEVERLAKWTKMMRPRKHDLGANVVAWSADGYGTTKETFHRRVWKGIPDRWRPAAWQLLIHQSRHSSRPFVGQGDILNQYRTTSDMPSAHDVQIDLDVPRTVSNHVLFHTRYGLGQRSLFHILHSFSLFCSECEYCQGMGPIAATLLLLSRPRVFKPGFPGLLEGIYVQERLLETLMPEVYKSFQKHMISSTSYATKWYITLFANSVPFQTQLRIWDAFLLEGRDVIIVFAVAILWSLRVYLASPQASLETILSLLSSYFVPEDEDILVSWVQTTLGNKQIRSQMTQWRQSWQGLIASGQDSIALI
ncbi:hypothetical protein BS47DRAFT_1471403 [Hydnum rufescens UP504]|uniref:Rab-GAP TBC domain-containing protein n=1 Tax=Hydnum rufescens UP504 TaxID=1448309 RepID=A0A9P6DQF6_9AGAM|nr:hypothetical protein BS47DRAFT_1471403 [Hydnum rufescens UP504]